MKFFDKWFYRKARWCWHRAGQEYPELKAEQDCMDELSDQPSTSVGNKGIKLRDSEVVSTDNSGIDLERPIRFNVAAAEGGMIVEVSSYDHKNDRRITKHHIIPDDVEDKSAAIAKIVTWEFMRRPQ